MSKRTKEHLIGKVADAQRDVQHWRHTVENKDLEIKLMQERLDKLGLPKVYGPLDRAPCVRCELTVSESVLHLSPDVMWTIDKVCQNFKLEFLKFCRANDILIPEPKVKSWLSKE